MKIALITDGIWPYVMGGMQKHSYYLAKFLAAEGVFVQVYFTTKKDKVETFYWEEHFTINELQYLEFIEVNYPISYSFPGHYIYDSYSYSKNILGVFNKHQQKPDIVYIQGFSGWALMQSFRKMKIATPTILNFHGLEMFQIPSSKKHTLINALFRPFVRRNIKIADYSQSLGGKLTGILLEILKERNRIIELGIGVSSNWLQDIEQQPTNKIRKFVFLGRYERRKGIEELNIVIEELINQNNSNIYFEFIGPIPKNKQIIHSNIKYYGLVKGQETIQNILSNSDILVCPSYSEGMPTVILEAMANGCAIIATDVGAVNIEVSKENGWLIAPANKQQLKAAVIDACQIDSKELIYKKETSIKKVKELFLWETIVEKHIDVFKDIIKKSSNC